MDNPLVAEVRSDFGLTAKHGHSQAIGSRLGVGLDGNCLPGDQIMGTKHDTVCSVADTTFEPISSVDLLTEIVPLILIAKKQFVGRITKLTEHPPFDRFP